MSTYHIILFIDFKNGSINKANIRNSLKQKFWFQEGQDYQFHNICENKDYVRFFSLSDDDFDDVFEKLKQHPHKTPYTICKYPESEVTYGVSIPYDWE